MSSYLKEHKTALLSSLRPVAARVSEKGPWKSVDLTKKGNSTPDFFLIWSIGILIGIMSFFHVKLSHALKYTKHLQKIVYARNAIVSKLFEILRLRNHMQKIMQVSSRVGKNRFLFVKNSTHWVYWTEPGFYWVFRVFWVFWKENKKSVICRFKDNIHGILCPYDDKSSHPVF